MTVEELFVIWLAYKKIEVKKSSISTYTRKIDTYILPVFGQCLISDITVTMVSHFIIELMERLSSKTVIDIKTILQSALDFAYTQNFSDRKITIPSPPHVKTEVETFNTKDQKKITDYIIGHMNNHNFLILLSLSTGIRVGELCALKYKDIKKVCMIRHTIQRIKNLDSDELKTCLHVGTPKSKLSLRPVPINESILKIFQGIYHKEKDDCYILTNTVEYSEPRLLEKHFKTLLKECHVPYKKFHTLRHTFATNALRCGIDIKTLAEIMGLSVKVLISTYLHSDIQQKIASMAKLQMA